MPAWRRKCRPLWCSCMTHLGQTWGLFVFKFWLYWAFARNLGLQPPLAKASRPPPWANDIPGFVEPPRIGDSTERHMVQNTDIFGHVPRDQKSIPNLCTYYQCDPSTTYHVHRFWIDIRSHETWPTLSFLLYHVCLSVLSSIPGDLPGLGSHEPTAQSVDDEGPQQVLL